MKNTQRGFTLIELLVVVSIIGMLASTVLVAVQAARDKGAVARNQTFATHIRSALYDPASAKAQVSFSFNEGSGSTVADDFGTNGLTLFSASWSTNTPGSSGYSIALGVPSIYGVFNSPVSVGSALTIAYWINTSVSDGGQAPIFTNRNGSTGIYLGTHNNLPAVFTSSWFDSTKAINDGKWHYVAWSENPAGGSKFYIDGSLNSTNPSFVYTPLVSANPYYLGRDGSSFITGTDYIDDFRIYDQLLSAADINRLYAEGKTTRDFAVVGN